MGLSMGVSLLKELNPPVNRRLQPSARSKWISLAGLKKKESAELLLNLITVVQPKWVFWLSWFMRSLITILTSLILFLASLWSSTSTKHEIVNSERRIYD